MSDIRALVIGGTGAIGRHIVGQLLLAKVCLHLSCIVHLASAPRGPLLNATQEFSKVTMLARRPVTLTDEYKDLQGSAKLNVTVVGSSSCSR